MLQEDTPLQKGMTGVKVNEHLQSTRTAVFTAKRTVDNKRLISESAATALDPPRGRRNESMHSEAHAAKV